MKKNTIIYWAATGIVCALMLFSAFGYFTSDKMKEAFVHLGFPSYFRVELGVAKILGVVALLLPMVSAKFKEFAYFGFAIVFISAFIAHLSSGDAIVDATMPLVFFVFLCVSYYYSNKLATN